VDQWKDFVGGPIWWRNKSKMADGRHLGFRFWARDFVFSLLDPLLEVVYSRWWMTPKGGVAKVTWPTFEAMGQIPAFHRTYFLLSTTLCCRVHIPSCIWNLLSTFLFLDLFSRCSLVAIFIGGLVVSSVVVVSFLYNSISSLVWPVYYFESICWQKCQPGYRYICVVLYEDK